MYLGGTGLPHLLAASESLALDWEDPGARRAATAAVAWGHGDGEALLFSGDDGGGVVAWGCDSGARELHLSTEAALLR